ncbi:hypothetical protein BC669P2_00040 [Bacteroides phage BC669P2]|nr:hypothetical protein BC669P2_00040 [Bacteroides phage BC669P2]
MERLQDIGQILALCVQMTNLKLEDSCGFDRQFAAQWYENEYLTGKHTRYVMKPDLSITSYEDGKVYRAFNCDDAKAVELMEANPEYKDYFIDLDAPEQTEPEQTEPEQTEPEQTETEPEQAEPEQAEPEQAEPEQAEPTPEEIAEAEAAAKRSEAAKKAAATRAAKKAAAEAEAAEADISEFE